VDKQARLDLAEEIDAFRIFPRLFFGAYIVLFLCAGFWAMSLPVLSATQAALVGTIITAGAAWSKFYNDTGRQYGEEK
jgi:hypothetical protein